MKVAPRRYAMCMECSEITDDSINQVMTVQWLREITIPQSRSSWGPRHPQAKYVCSVCGATNY